MENETDVTLNVEIVFAKKNRYDRIFRTNFQSW